MLVKMHDSFLLQTPHSTFESVTINLSSQHTSLTPAQCMASVSSPVLQMYSKYTKIKISLLFFLICLTLFRLSVDRT